ncbi:MAG TPA: response regulator [Pirellulales bacterium]|nr:response regulator [Pirellulales bacterium]
MACSRNSEDYALAVVACALALLLCQSIEQMTGESSPLLPFVLSVALAAWRGGLGPGLLATVLGMLFGAFFFTPPPVGLRFDSFADGLAASSFVLSGIIISLLGQTSLAGRLGHLGLPSRVLVRSSPGVQWTNGPEGGRLVYHSRGYELPALAPAPHDDEHAAGGQPAEAAGRTSSYRILVVDDLQESAETLALVLRSLGHDAVPLFDGESALRWTRVNVPDVAFLDIGMPGLDGYEVARRIRQLPGHAHMALIALSGFEQRIDQLRAYEAGFDSYLTKPTNVEELAELLRHLPCRKMTVAQAGS